MLLWWYRVRFIPVKRRVSLVPPLVPSLMNLGLEVVLEAGGAGKKKAGLSGTGVYGKGARVLFHLARCFSSPRDMVVQVLCQRLQLQNGRGGCCSAPSTDQLLIGFSSASLESPWETIDGYRIQRRILFPL